jgi:hypothetical protein
MSIGAISSGISNQYASQFAAAKAGAPGVASAAASPAASESAASGATLSPEALKLIEQLKARDTEVRQHEQAHLAAAGGMALSGATYTYQRGPNGVSYAIGGEVQIDTSPGGTPEETIARAGTIKAAALAPANPSGPDRAVAAAAQQMEAQARVEQAQEKSPQQETTPQSASPTQSTGAADQSARVRGAYASAPPTAPTLNVYA